VTTKKKTSKKKAVKKAAKSGQESKRKTGHIARALTVSATEVGQGNHVLYLFKAKASVLYDALSINRRISDKDEGYQRVLSSSRVQAITRYIRQNRTIPGAIIVSLDKAKFDKKEKELTIPAGTNVGWVIDGQHRLAGAAMAARDGTDIEFAVVAFIGLTDINQIEQFVTINREGKNVPTSLYLDLLHYLPHKRPGDVAKERATDLATQLRKDEESPFYERIVVTTPPKSGQTISLTNFVRKISILVAPDKGFLNAYTEPEQARIISNYFEGLRQVFPKEFEAKDSMFFKTLGFGALWNVFPTFFSLTLKNQSGFTVKDVATMLRPIQDTDFSTWAQYGSGDQAERTAAEDLRTSLLLAFQTDAEQTTLKL
jgi:DGQHR domain-containing protein